MVMQPALVKNPFGMLPATPQMSIGNGGSAPSVQYGISSLPVSVITALTILIVLLDGLDCLLASCSSENFRKDRKVCMFD